MNSFYIQPTKWSAFSVINPPGREPTLSKPEIPPGCTPPTFKITGERDTQERRKIRQSAWDLLHAPTDYTRTSDSYGTAYQKKKPSDASQTNVYSSSISKKSNSVTPSFHTAPFATETPVSREDISKLENRYRASLMNYNSTLVGARARGKAEFAKEPKSVYKYPPTTGMEYGWIWTQGRNPY
jgi:hypothetical protein